MKREIKFREQLAALEHEQWMEWASSIIKTEAITKDRTQRWQGLMIPYAYLTEEQKDQDRIWADKSIELIEPLIKEAETRIQLARLDADQEGYQAGLKRGRKEVGGLERERVLTTLNLLAEHYEANIDGFVVPRDKWQALKEKY